LPEETQAQLANRSAGTVFENFPHYDTGAQFFLTAPQVNLLVELADYIVSSNADLITQGLGVSDEDDDDGSNEVTNILLYSSDNRNQLISDDNTFVWNSLDSQVEDRSDLRWSNCWRNRCVWIWTLVLQVASKPTYSSQTIAHTRIVVTTIKDRRCCFFFLHLCDIFFLFWPL
jgi:hypothetical protein